jgi:hypothetical protein
MKYSLPFTLVIPTTSTMVTGVPSVNPCGLVVVTLAGLACVIALMLLLTPPTKAAIDVDYDLNVPVSTTSIRLSDVNSNNKDIALVAGGNMTITRDNANQLTIAALVGGVSKSISAITQANPARVTTTNPHGFTEGTPVTIVDVVGMTNVNGNEYFMNVIDGNNFDLYTDDLLSTGLNSTGFPAYVSGGVATADYGGAKQAFKTIMVSATTSV